MQLAAGLSNKDIGRKLFIGVGTVKTHVHRILRKLTVDNRTAAVKRGRDLGLVD